VSAPPPDWIRCWVTTPAGTVLGHLDRSTASPFRAFAFVKELAGPGGGSLEYALPNAHLDETPGLLDQGNLVWMKFRGETVVWIIEETTRRLAGEETGWAQISGRGTRQLLSDRLVWPDGFSEDDLDPSIWSGPGVLATVLTQRADDGDHIIVVDDADRWREGQRVTITDGSHTDTTHIRRMHLRDDGDWALTLRRGLSFDYPIGADVVRQVPAFLATTLVASVTAGKRKIVVDSAKRLHPGRRILIESGIVGEYAIVREVDHVRAKGADSTGVAVAASAGDHSVIIAGNHFHVGETVTIAGGGNSENRTIRDRTQTSTSPVRWRLRFDTDLAHGYSTSANVSRGPVAESWTVTLRRPLQHGYPIGADVTRPSDQWYTVVATAAGEMLWELIANSNARSTTTIVQGTVEEDPDDEDQWTQRFRFDNLGDVTDSVTNAYGDVEMDGLTFNYWLAMGTDRSDTILLEEGRDLLRVERSVDHRDAVTWVVAEGVGEGPRAKLAVSSDDIAPRRREGYLDSHDSTNLPMLEAAADAALAQNGVKDAIGLEVAETRYAAFTDWGLGDWVHVSAPSRAMHFPVRVVSITVAETDERVRVSIDVNSRRTEWLLELEKGAAAARSTLGIHGRQPQGQLVPLTFSGSSVFDEDIDMEVMFDIPDRLFLIVEARLKVQLRRFWAPSKAASAGGASTETSGSSSASSSASGGGATSTSNLPLETTDHTHSIFSSTGAAHGYTTPTGYIGTPGGMHLDLLTDGAAAIGTAVTPVPHHHDVNIPSHSHGIGHTHDVSLPSHTHGLDYGIFREGWPVDGGGADDWRVHVYVDQLDGSSWDQVWSDSIETGETFYEVDLSAIITEPGSWRIRLGSYIGHDNEGRLAADVWGSLVAALEST
jgi:hypothetical protein